MALVGSRRESAVAVRVNQPIYLPEGPSKDTDNETAPQGGQ